MDELKKITDSAENMNKKSLLERILDFSRQCYIHGVMTGFEISEEIHPDCRGNSRKEK